ncbi:YncE family protein [[Erwinia] mediterraneensis]|uniref:YncE family protein n=1 Tax=[Erwinia] mediterraneensis TaxID=2161819 RepID=UPI00102FDCFD|nr:YncE family protein [[Erwinia] mediterraneensis]
MKSQFSLRKAGSALAVVAALSLSACQAPGKQAQTPAQPTVAASQPDKQQVQQRELAEGLYEMVYSRATRALWVASALDFKRDIGGAIYRLDAATLQTRSVIHSDLKNFGMTSDPAGEFLYITNSLDGGISKVDAQSGKVVSRLLFKEKNAQGYPFGTREIIWHDGKLYIGGVGEPGVIWVVDAQTMKLKTRIKNAGKWVTGLLWSSFNDRLYAANGGGEILVINPHSNRIEARWKPEGEQPALLLNLAEDPASGRLFVTDSSRAKTTLVIDERSGKVIKRLGVGDSLGIKFNAKRNEIYISQRESGKVLQLDATSYAVKNSWSFPTHPNSLLLSADSQTLFVTLKQGFNKDHSSKGVDSVVRISLN